MSDNKLYHTRLQLDFNTTVQVDDLLVRKCLQEKLENVVKKYMKGFSQGSYAFNVEDIYLVEEDK
jgi:hypothetical protein